MPQLTDKVIIITGATSGIGRDTALAAARAGAKLVVTGRREDRGRALEDELKSLGTDALYVKADASKEADHTALIKATLDRFGTFHGAFNNAGVEGQFAPAVEQTEENYRFTFDINVLGVLLSLKHQLPHLVKQGHGSIVNTSSIVGLVGMPGTTVYGASKWAVTGMTKSAALEIAKSGVRVNAVCPALIETEMAERAFGAQGTPAEIGAGMHPNGRVGKPADVTSLVLWLLSDESAFTTGQAIAVDGGYTAQ